MKVYRNLCLAGAAMIFLLILWLVGAKYVTLQTEAEMPNMADEMKTNVGTGAEDPCWFNTKAGVEAGDSAALKMIRDRQLFGFENDVPLEDAIKIFNLEEIQCFGPHREYPPLTEEELVAAIVVGVNQNERGTVYHKERDALWKIVTKRMMPKGSVLRAWNGGNIQESPLAPSKTVNAKGIEVFLILGADKNGRSGIAAPTRLEELVIIRKTFSGIEIR